jgi:hypothetical protein
MLIKSAIFKKNSLTNPMGSENSGNKRLAL